MKQRKEQPPNSEPAADSPTRFVPAFKRFMAMIEWTPDNAHESVPLDAFKKPMKFEPHPSIRRPPQD